MARQTAVSNVAVTNTFSQWLDRFNTVTVNTNRVYDNIGDTAALVTAAANCTGAINELNRDAGSRFNLTANTVVFSNINSRIDTQPQFVWNDYTNTLSLASQSAKLAIGTTVANTALEVSLDNGPFPSSLSANTVAIFKNSSTSTDHVGISVISGNAADGWISFGDTDTEIMGYVSYENDLNILKFGTQSTERMRITANGMVGIGTSTVLANLHVHMGDLATFPPISNNTMALVSHINHSTNNAGISIMSGNAADAWIALGDTDAEFAGYVSYLHDLNVMKFATQSTERVRIDQLGNVAVANFTTSTSISSNLEVGQLSPLGKCPALGLAQVDESEGFIEFKGLDSGTVAEDLDSLKSVRVELNGTIYRLALYVDA